MTTVDVVVLEIIAHPRPELIYGQQVNLSCSTGEQLPNDMKLNWTLPKTSSPNILYPTHITVPEVGKEDNGKWGCELWQGGNKLTSVEILLKIEPRLSVWMLVIICSAAVILLLLLVLAFIHYRRRKQKMRLRRHRLCQCKNPKPKGFYRTWKLADRIFKKKREHAEFLIWYVLIYLNYLDLHLSFCHIGKYKRVLLDWGSNISGNLDWFYVFYVWLLPSVTLIHLHFESICRLNFLYPYVYFLRRSVMLSDV